MGAGLTVAVTFTGALTGVTRGAAGAGVTLRKSSPIRGKGLSGVAAVGVVPMPSRSRQLRLSVPLVES